MDRNVVIATILIVLILFVWMYIVAPPPPPPAEDATLVDTVEVVEPREAPDVQALTAPPAVVVDSTIAGVLEGEERFITVDSDLYRARFSTKGGTLVSFELKDYQQFDQVTPVQLVDSTSTGAISFAFTTPSNRNADTRDFYFDADFQGDRLGAGKRFRAGR